jgi:hypothetical protein
VLNLAIEQGLAPAEGKRVSIGEHADIAGRDA